MEKPVQAKVCTTTEEVGGNLPPILDREFEMFRDLIYKVAGISMGAAKKPLISSRLGRRIKHYRMSSFGEYYGLITSSQGALELQTAVDLLTTNETHFFREPKHFELLRHQVLPERRAGRPFRIWSAACSSGEEPYSIAMLLDDVLGSTHAWEIHASDLSTRMLEKARSGLYSIERAAEIPQHFLSKHCLKGVGRQEGTLLIDRRLRDRVAFMQHNLTDHPPKMGEFDVIFLRNVMIYFDMETKKQVVSRLLPLLRSGGYFLVSHSETLNGVTEALKVVKPSVYKKP